MIKFLENCISRTWWMISWFSSMKKLMPRSIGYRIVASCGLEKEMTMCRMIKMNKAFCLWGVFVIKDLVPLLIAIWTKTLSNHHFPTPAIPIKPLSHSQTSNKTSRFPTKTSTTKAHNSNKSTNKPYYQSKSVMLSRLISTRWIRLSRISSSLCTNTSPNTGPLSIRATRVIRKI